MEITLPAIMGTRYIREADNCEFYLIWDYDDLCIDIPSFDMNKEILILLQDAEDGTLLITTMDKLAEEYDLAPNPNIELTFET